MGCDLVVLDEVVDDLGLVLRGLRLVDMWRGHLGRDLLRRCLGTVRELSDVLLGQTRRPAPHPGAFVQRRGVDRLEAHLVIRDAREDVCLDEAPAAYEHFDARDEGWTKVVLHPNGHGNGHKR